MRGGISTGTLGWSAIENAASYKASSYSAGGGFSVTEQKDDQGNVKKDKNGNSLKDTDASPTMPFAMSSSGSASGTTNSAVSAGTITVRNGNAQQQNVSELSRDTDNANGSIGKIFDKDKVASDMELAKGITELAGQFSSDLSRNKVQDAKAEAENRLMLTSDKYRQATPAERASMLADDATYHEQIKTWGVGGTVPMAITAVTAAFSGITAGNLGAAASGAMAPYIARQIKAATGDNVIANAMAHAVEGAVLAQMAGNSATAGAVGSAGGELIARSIVATLYPGVEAQNLTEEQKHIVSALSQISSGILGGLEGNSVAAIATAQVAGKNAVENNLLGGNEETQTKFVQEHGKNIASCSTDPSSASCQKGLAMNDALMVALPAGLGGGLLAAATPEIAAAAKAAIQACAGNVVLCLNNAGIQMSEAIVPGGVGAGGAVGIGKTAAEATAAKAEATAANAAKNVGKGTTGSLSGQPTKLPPNASAENIRSLQRENEGAAILSQNGYHVEQNPVTPGVKNPDYKINGEVFDNIAPKTNSVRNIYDRALEKVNSGQTNNVVINLADTKASVSDLQKQFSDWPIKGLDKVIVIDQSGKPIRIK